jgi:hypothetical protein
MIGIQKSFPFKSVKMHCLYNHYFKSFCEAVNAGANLHFELPLSSPVTYNWLETALQGYT